MRVGTRCAVLRGSLLIVCKCVCHLCNKGLLLLSIRSSTGRFNAYLFFVILVIVVSVDDSSIQADADSSIHPQSVGWV